MGTCSPTMFYLSSITFCLLASESHQQVEFVGVLSQAIQL